MKPDVNLVVEIPKWVFFFAPGRPLNSGP